MRLRAFLSHLIAASLLASSPVVVGAPVIQKTKVRQNLMQFGGNTACMSTCGILDVQIYDDEFGVRTGRIFTEILYLSSGTFEYFVCTGPEFANALVVDMRAFTATLNATLSSTNPHCEYSSQQTIVINMTAVVNPESFKDITSATTLRTDSTGTTKYKVDNLFFGALITGSSGFINEPFTGFVNIVDQKIASGS